MGVFAEINRHPNFGYYDSCRSPGLFPDVLPHPEELCGRDRRIRGPEGIGPDG